MEFEDLDKQVEWEAKRVAAAFEVKALRSSSDALHWFYKGQAQGNTLSWMLEHRTGRLVTMSISHGKPRCELYRLPAGGWQCSPAPSLAINGQMVRGLYCLGIEHGDAIAPLPTLTIQEKLHLRVSMAREFWPKTWRDEDGKATMSEQQVEAFADRLKRIWGPVQHELLIPEQDDRVFDAALKTNVRLEVRGRSRPGRPEFFLSFFIQEPRRLVSEVAELRASQDGMITYSPVYEEDQESADQFVREWMDFFRRGCWLSGCPIEVTAHEKAEWIQGFTREEVESWNLKM